MWIKSWLKRHQTDPQVFFHVFSAYSIYYIVTVIVASIIGHGEPWLGVIVSIQNSRAMGCHTHGIGFSDITQRQNLWDFSQKSYEPGSQASSSNE